MGRQYNFYIEPILDERFCEKIFKDGNRIYYFDRSDGEKKLYSCDDYIALYEYKASGGMFFIYNDKWGDFASLSDEKIFRDKSPVIEYVRPYIDESKKVICRGRVYINTYYKDDINGFDIVNKEFDRLVRWLKKQIDYKEYDFGGMSGYNRKNVEFNVTSGIVQLVKSGYSLRGY